MEKQKRKSNDIDIDLTKQENEIIKKVKIDKYEENLICGICQALLYKCVTLIPCMHNFCQACYSEWKKRNSTCPQCRIEITSVRRNFAIINLVETYLEQNPEKKRSEEELKEMDEICKKPGAITDEMLRNQQEKHNDSLNLLINFPTMSRISIECRECRTPNQDGFRCPAVSPLHEFCHACHQPFPKRTDHSIPVYCTFCKNVYCDRYWGCSSPFGQGQLKELKDFQIDLIPSTALLGIEFEIQILKDYMEDSHKTINSIFHECLNFMDEGKYGAFGLKIILKIKNS
jgi:E3 ubiquitin-protein ligase CHFR